jgi:hypothetical protein
MHKSPREKKKPISLAFGHEVDGCASETDCIVVAVRYRLSLHGRGRLVQTRHALIKVDRYTDDQEKASTDTPEKQDLPASNGTLDVYSP